MRAFAHAKKRKPEVLIIYRYRNPALRLQEVIAVVSFQKRGCVERFRQRFFVRREISEIKRRCLTAKQWKKIKQALNEAEVFELSDAYPCKEPDKKRASQALVVERQGRRKEIEKICIAGKSQVPTALHRLLKLLKKLGHDWR